MFVNVNNDLIPQGVGLPIARYKQLEAWPGACQVELFAWERLEVDASGISKLRLFMIDQIAGVCGLLYRGHKMEENKPLRNENQFSTIQIKYRLVPEDLRRQEMLSASKSNKTTLH